MDGSQRCPTDAWSRRRKFPGINVRVKAQVNAVLPPYLSRMLILVLRIPDRQEVSHGQWLFCESAQSSVLIGCLL
jgi:hypothetical protein